MIQNQLGAFVSAFSELWPIEHEARERLKDHGSAFQSKWAYVWAIVAMVGLQLVWKSDWPLLGWLLLLGPWFWLSNALESEAVAKVARAELEQVRWKEFDLRFQWRAVGLYDAQLAELKRVWHASSGALDFDSDAYRAWWAGASEQLSGA